MSERDIFTAACELTDPAARAAYLGNACGGDAGLKARVEALLRAHDRPDSLLDHPAVAPHDPDPDATRTVGHEGGVATDDEVPLGFLEPATRPDSLGRIGHYEVLQVLGHGGFGIVFRAFDDVLHRVVAVKVLAPQMASTSPARKRFLREARSSAQVRHENVVQVYEVGETPLPYIAMEFIPGETLQDRLNRIGPVDPPEVVRIGRQIAEGLAAAHGQDLIHRDIKPGNVLLEGGAGRVKITDFGLARAADDASISQSGIIAGTPMYMAPEQAKGEKLDQRADLFSLGSVLYQMAAGRPPFRANSTVAVLKRVAEDTPRDIREIVPEVPQWLCDIIAKLHAKNPDDRYQSAREVADVLADCEAQLKANSKLKDFSRIPLSKQPTTRKSGSWKWAAAAVVLLPVLALAVTEFAGVTQLFRPQATPNPITPGGDQTPVLVAKQEPLPPTFTNGIGMEFVVVPKGKSWLGGGKDKLGDKEVEFPADFYLGKYEVTQEEWVKVMGENPSHFSRTGGGKDAVKDVPDADLKRFPVERVSWEQCQLFVAKLNKLEKETGWVYRLPKEAEWEYACRGGPMVLSDKLDSAYDFYFAKPTNTLLPEQANFTPAEGRGLKRTSQVGSYEPNSLGLYDMHGNVWEWCDDTEKAADGASHGVWRGGGWNDDSWLCRAAYRYTFPPSYRQFHLGLRLARVPVGTPSPAAKSPPPAVAPFTDADVQRIAALPAEQQVEEVRKELKRLNPKFDGKVEPTIDNGVVTGLKFLTDEVDNIAPVRALKGLVSLDCSRTNEVKGKLSDLSPLKGMALTSLNLEGTDVTDLSPLKGMPLKYLRLWDDSNVADLTPLEGMPLKSLLIFNLRHVKDLSPLKGMPLVSLLCRAPVDDLTPLKDMKLTSLDIEQTHVTDLSPLKGMPLGLLMIGECKTSDLTPLKGMPLKTLNIWGTQIQDLTPLQGMPLKSLSMFESSVTDLSPLKGMQLESIRLTPKNITQGLDILRGMKSLKTIGIHFFPEKIWPAAEFWERYDKGEFGKAAAPAPVADTDRKAAEYVLSIGGEITVNEQGPAIKAVTNLPREAFRLTWVGLPNNKQVTDAGLAAFKDCKNLGGLQLEGAPVTDAGLIHLKDGTGLTGLDLCGTKVTDAGLAHLKGCTKLTYLQLGDTQTTDAGLSHFKDCKNLMHLNLSRTQVGDAGLARLKECGGLTTLWLDGAPVTDAGLSHLTGLDMLIELKLARTKVTARGVEGLAKALPKCKIAWDGGTIEPK
ncbi:bifunctional serine/threonine-protein kinase/formylglycine-generating enzyme family protein [Urbifossiella limnaea]|uniref:non-specific serine/threonine protein kinase n=1 Tax=Urbifossiella limnaea TaxID=2528023 RepID=A0A517XUX0_9BACT|nr:bifunctional serine/threonine-protein kinase/formylglycine-generating enzyme family protein [Urbifossiella limnaea]QDU21310.1 Serine/threonine-protein kinase PrkC [Urbifossiella limnaea]